MRFTVHFNGSDTLDIIDSELLVKDPFFSILFLERNSNSVEIC